MSDSNILHRYQQPTHTALASFNNLPNIPNLSSIPSLRPIQSTIIRPSSSMQPSLASGGDSTSGISFAPSTSQASRDDYTTFLSRYTTVYSSLNSPVNMETQTRSRKEVMEYQENILDVLRENDYEPIEMSEEMTVLGFTADEVKEFQAINKYVSKGRSLLLCFLKEHGQCETKSEELTHRLAKTKEALGVIKYNLFSLEDNHVSFKELRDEFISKMTQKETAVLEDLQSEQGILQIRKDKLECAIRYLLTTYNILKSTAAFHACPICLTNEIDAFIDPCGHTLCTKCSSKITYCHMCRTKVKVAKSIYFS